MYQSYWGLREKPFRKTPDPRYLFLNDTYEEALERLIFAVEEVELALLTGEVGSGKTLLTRALVDRLGDRYEVGMILNPRLSPRQFLKAAAAELGVAQPRFYANDLLEQIHERLLELDGQGRAALLIVDEAHLIPGKPTFEEIRLLTNFQLDDRNLVAIVLVGQPELRERLRHRAYRALTQRIGVSFDLVPLAVEDTRDYLAHRLAVAGGSAPCSPRGGRAPARGRRGHPARAEPARDPGARRGHGARRATGGRRGRGGGREPRGTGTASPRGREGREHGSNGRRAEAGTAGRHRRRAVAGAAPPSGREPVVADVPAADRGRRRRRTDRGRVGLPASGLAEDILRQLEAERREPDLPEAAAPGRVELPASGLAEDVLAREEAPAGSTACPSSRRPVQDHRAAAEATEHLATFFLDREEYGVDVRQVQEIRRMSEITSVPRAPEFIRGVINLRGRILPVLDLKRKLGLGEVEAGRATRIVVVRVRERLLGLLVDGASQVLKVEVSRVEPPPEEVVERGGDYIRGVAKLDDRLIILVDLERLLAHELRAAGAPAPRARAAEAPDGVS